MREAFVRAGAREYRARLWIIAALFGVAFVIRGPRVVHGVRGVLDVGDDAALRVVFVLSAILVAMAAALRTWGTAHLGAEAVQDAEPRTEGVVADGPYRHVRNPLYLALLVYAVGLGTWASITGWCVLVVALVVFVYRLIAHEELALLDAQGEAYAAYCDAVPNRLLPSVRPLVASRGRAARWSDALVGELFMWGSVAACVVGAITLRTELASAVLGASFAARIVVRRLRRPRVAAASASPDESAAAEP